MTATEIRTAVSAMTARQLDDVIVGRVRVGDTQAEQLAAWNAAIDEERDR